MSHIDTSAHLNRWRRKALAEKSLLAIGLLLIAVAVPSWQSALLVAALMSCATLFGAGVPFQVWRKSMLAPIGFLLVGVVTLVFQVRPWHIAIAPHGLELAGRVGARALAGLTCLLFLALTTPAVDLVAGMRRLGVPEELAEMTLLVYRFVFTLTGTAETMNAAQQARLGHSTYRRHLHSLGLLIANLMPRALARAQALETGLAARDWHGELRVLRNSQRPSALGIGLILAVEVAVLLMGLHTL